MSTELQQMDAVQLREEINSIRNQVNGLLERLEELEQRLDALLHEEKEIAHDAEMKSGPGRPHGVANDGRRLEEFIVEVLQNSNEPLSAAEVAELVLESGYKTASKKNFVNIVLQALVRSPAIRRVTRGKTRPTRYALLEES